MKRILLSIALALCAFSSYAQTDTKACPAGSTQITSAPFTVSSSDAYYCFAANVAYNDTSGNAITISPNVYRVTIDLNGYRLAGSLDPSTLAVGISASNAAMVTVRNGTIYGFNKAVEINDPRASVFTYDANSGHSVSNLRVMFARYRGIVVQGAGVNIEDNQVVGVGGSTITAAPVAIGIDVYGPGTNVLRNTVSNTVTSGSGEAVGISSSDGGRGVVIRDNLINNPGPLPSGRGYGIWVGGRADTPNNVLVINNQITNFTNGLAYSSTTHGAYRDNLTHGSTNPYVISSTDVLDAGNNK